MSKSLGGTIFCYNAISQDYCLTEAVASLKELCDEVVVLDAGSTDKSDELCKSFADEKTKVMCLPNSAWQSQVGREKLSYFTNIAIDSLSTEWNFNLQSDEVIHQDSFPYIREAIEQNEEGFWSKRINLWGNSQHYLSVEESRKPVGDVVLRLCKKQYHSINDAQSIHCPDASWDLLNDIRIYHFGFVRNKFIHTKKIKHMLEDVFLMGGNDPKVEAMNGVFNPWVHFSKDDVVHISEPLPKFAKAWAEERDKINEFSVK